MKEAGGFDNFSCQKPPAVSIFYPTKSKNLHCLGVVTPPDLSIFCNIGVVTPPDRRSSATLGGDTLACSPFMRTLMCAPGGAGPALT